MAIEYYYFTNRIPQGNHAPKPTPVELPYGSTSIKPLKDENNPIFNFSSDFVENYQQLSPIQVGSAVPYIGLCGLNVNGDVIVDFNKEFFSKTIDMDAVNNETRYADRPQMSVQSVSISTDLAAGGGFLSFSQVSLTLKLHKPDMLSNSKLVALLLPGMMMRLTYGWQCPSSKFLDVKDILLFNIQTYDIAFDVTGQANLVVQGRTHSENLGNIYCGDKALPTPPTPHSSEAQLDGVYSQSERISNFISYVDALDVQPNSEGKRSVAVIKQFGQLYVKTADRLTRAVKKNFVDKMNELASYKENTSKYFDDVTRIKKNKSTTHGECVTLHDVIATLCGDTLSDLQGTLIPANRKYRIVYGSFNDKIGSFSGTNLSNFPIHWGKFHAAIMDYKESGDPVPTINSIFTLVCDEFLSDEDYWRTHLVNDKSELDIPDVSVYISSHLNNKEEIVQITFMDTNKDVPLTQEVLHSSNAQFLSEKQQEDLVAGGTGIPIIRFGHANAFVKNISISHTDDATMKALLINRADNAINSLRKSIPEDLEIPLSQKRALFLPLKGTLDIIGHVDWKPARFFYISSGIFFLDGMYIITKVEHVLDSGGFNTHVEMSMH